MQPSPKSLTLTLYNPDLLSKDDLIRGFVARMPLLNELLDDLRRAGKAGGSQHYLLLGQRGLGKTTLLRRFAFAITDDPELSSTWIPLIFPEEQYNVSSLGDFWANCCDALSDWLERTGKAAEAEILDERVQALGRRPDAGPTWIWCSTASVRIRNGRSAAFSAKRRGSLLSAPPAGHSKPFMNTAGRSTISYT
jgi:hypothetical protein